VSHRAPQVDVPQLPEGERVTTNVTAIAELLEKQRQGILPADEHWLGGQAIELERDVNPSGNVKVGQQQFWIGPPTPDAQWGSGWTPPPTSTRPSSTSTTRPATLELNRQDQRPGGHPN
jgi:hypothetical protein